jgi:hypothetical protein
VSHQRRGLVLFLLATLGCSVPFGVILWVWCTHDLHLNVYTDQDVVLYQEYFPAYFNLIVTVVLSLILGLIAAALVCLTRCLMRRETV